MFPEPTELLLIGCLIESIWTPRSKSNTLTPRTNSQTYWQREISHVMIGITCVFVQHQQFQFHQKSWSDAHEDVSEERVTAKSKPMMNLVSQCRVRDPNVLASTASESPEKTKSESQNVPLSSLNVHTAHKNGETRMRRTIIPQSCQVKVWIGKYGETRILLKHQKSCWINQPKSQNHIKIRITNKYGETVFRKTGMVARIQRKSCGW